MMEDGEVIISLIQQDFKYRQLLLGLKHIGFETDIHELTISEIVAQLMGIKKGEESDQWCEVYLSFAARIKNYEITERGQNLKPLAKECFKLLRACLEVEKLAKDFVEV